MPPALDTFTVQVLGEPAATGSGEQETDVALAAARTVMAVELWPVGLRASPE